MYQLFKHQPLFVFLVIVGNILLSIWGLHLDPIINNDGVTYTALAKLFSQGHWSVVFDYYNWPFYSFFISLTCQLFFVDAETAAHILNVFFIISLCLAFICIVKELSNDNPRIVYIAAILILLFPSTNKYRTFIIRDFGYLSCYLWSLFFIFRFCRSLDKKHLIGWLLFAGLSFLFRFEGIIFILIAPYFLLLFTAEKLPHKRKILSLLSASIIAICSLLIFWYLSEKYNSIIQYSNKLGDNLAGPIDLFFANIQSQLGGQDMTFANYTKVMLGNLGSVAYEIVRRLAIIYLILAIYAYAKKLCLQQPIQKRIWWTFLITNILLLIGYSVYNNFLVSRYTLATVLTILLLAPFAIDKLIDAFNNSKLPGKIAIGFLFFILAAISIDRLNISTDKRYLKAGGQWLAENIPQQATVYSNNKLLVYYAQRHEQANLIAFYSLTALIKAIKTGLFLQYDYIALAANRDIKIDEITRQTLSYKLGAPIHVIKQDNYAVFIFKNEKSELNSTETE